MFLKLKQFEKALLDFENLIINDFIGKGSSGTVYQGEYKKQNCIIKCFSLDNYYDEESWIEDIYTELSNYDLIKNSKYCCKLIGYTYDDDNLYLVLKDYNVKGDLSDLLNDNKFWKRYDRFISENEYYYKYYNNKWLFNLDREIKIKLTKELINGIYELHSLDIVHCDLKTNNLLYNLDQNQLVLIDFGASHYLNKKKEIEINLNMGTVGYCCPALNYEGICSKKSDIYSLAVCIVEIWCGCIWEKSQSFRGTRKELLSSLKILSEKEYNLTIELKKCLNLNPKKRPYIKTVHKNINKLFTV